MGRQPLTWINAFGEEVPYRDKGLDRLLAVCLGIAVVMTEAQIYYVVGWFW